MLMFEHLSRFSKSKIFAGLDDLAIALVLAALGVFVAAGFYGEIPSFWGPRPPLTDTFPRRVWPAPVNPLLDGPGIGDYPDICAGIEDLCRRMREGDLGDKVGYWFDRQFYKHFSYQSTHSLIWPAIPSIGLWVIAWYAFSQFCRKIVAVRRKAVAVE
jgi:hypothetical protein